MAILLGVTRVQWALFLTGRRSLPTDALLKLTEMLTIVKEAETEAPDAAVLKEEQARINKYIEEEIIFNQHKQRLVSEQLQKCRKEYQSSQNAVRIADALMAKGQYTGASEQELLTSLKINAQNVLKKNSLLVQEQYTLKLLVLQQEEVVFKAKIIE
ncbi:hypothetical protein [Flavobacterium sp. ENC]|uniref:hypothetical protein n=1 Tax=Flavobacterium sp. ENC TaxID=2897330 RepID=UPI001E2D518C|nr:hypothetical protein [Flavobacterium sp. ENC]MCD0465971.1 hypothetical protein [Flavobacterium sp. ENC]